MKAACPNVCAIVVTYHPQQVQLANLLTCLLPQVGHIVLIDNGSGKATQDQLQELSQSSHISFLPQSDNGGIAKAQNTGIDFALRQGFDYILLMDQDSLPQADTVATLLTAIIEQQHPTAAVGPCFVDQRTGQQSHFVRFRNGMLRRQPPPINQGIIATDFLIASGMLIPANVLITVGKMDERLFIDHVDTEWCLRAAASGYFLFGVTGAKMLHELGEGSIKLRLFGNRSFPHHNPLRYYYGVRNSLLMLRRNYIPVSWRFALLLRCLVISISSLVFLPRKWLRIKMMGIGIADGLANRHGPFAG